MFSTALFSCFALLLTLNGRVSASDNAAAKTDPIATKVQQTVQDYHDRGEFDGVVLIAQGDKIVFQGGFGMADRVRRLPNTADTPYRICSITKQFTALLVMQLVEQGKLDLDQPIPRYLPDYRQDTGGKITIKYLLSHTSGLPNLDDALPEQNGIPGVYTATDAKFRETAYMVKTYCSGDLVSTPGEKFNYNNADYIVLQAILERVTTLSYAQLLAQRILRPLGMQHTGLITQDAFTKGQAMGYAREKGECVPEPYVHIPNFGAAGAMYSTAHDLLRWNRALDQGRLLTKKYREIMFTPYPANGYGALGSWVFPFYAKDLKQRPQIIDREGEIGAFHLSNLRVPEDGLSILVFSNVTAPDHGAAYMGKGIVFDLLKTLYK